MSRSTIEHDKRSLTLMRNHESGMRRDTLSRALAAFDRIAGLESQLGEVTAERDALRAGVAEANAYLTAELAARRAAKEGTMRVRIAVAVASDGSWGAGGWCANGATVDDESAADVAHEGCERSDARLTWVEADVPLPTPDPVLTVEGKVTP